MTVIINGTSGITDVNGTAAAPAITGTDTDTGVFFGTNTVSLSTGGTERLQVDSSGNLGLGVTPSAWSGFTALQIQNGALFTDSTSFRSIMNGYYNGSNWIYSTTNAATRYEQVNGIHRWFNAASGTAGNAISFTQAMTLDSGGRLLLGRTSSDANNFRFQISQSTDTYGSGVELTYSGVGSAGIWENSSGALCFGNDNASGTTERARIDSSGNFMVGTTGNAGTGTIIFANGTIGSSGYSCRTGTGGSFTGNNFNINWTGSVAELYIQNTKVVSNLSDYRFKKNIVSQTDAALPKVMSLRTVVYELADNGIYKADGIKREGFVAHELAEIIPSAVDGTKDQVAEDGSDIPQGLKLDAIVAVLTKAIQEQQAIITQLQADVAALKG